MRDSDVRKALHSRVLRDHHNDPNTLVLNELGIRHGVCRVDVAVVNGSLHGYELKSNMDTLERLPAQIHTYSKVLDKATLVVGERHAARALPLLPEWWGVKIAVLGKRGGITFETSRLAIQNAEIEPLALAELLWRSEVIQLLATKGFQGAALRQARSHLYRLLVEASALDELRDSVRACLKTRENWRGQRPSL